MCSAAVRNVPEVCPTSDILIQSSRIVADARPAPARSVTGREVIGPGHGGARRFSLPRCRSPAHRLGGLGPGPPGPGGSGSGPGPSALPPLPHAVTDSSQQSPESEVSNSASEHTRRPCLGQARSHGLQVHPRFRATAIRVIGKPEFTGQQVRELGPETSAAQPGPPGLVTLVPRRLRAHCGQPVRATGQRVLAERQPLRWVSRA